MIRFALTLLMSLAVSSQAVAAVKWNNPKSDSNGGASTTLNKNLKAKFDQFVFRREFKKNMVLTERNVPIRQGLIEFSEDYFGEKGVKFNLSYSDIGDQMDWSRHGNAGFAQRFQLEEQLKKTSKKGTDKWYRIQINYPMGQPVTNHTLNLFDFKMIHGKTEVDLGPSLSINNNNFLLMVPDKVAFSKTNETGNKAYESDTYALGLDQRYDGLLGKWLFIVMNAKWEKNGHFHIWINGKLRASYYGDMLRGADRVRFKFGPYRNYMTLATEQGQDIPDVNVYYSSISKTNKCEDLWNGCEELTAQLTGYSQAFGLKDASMCTAGDCRPLNPRNPFQ